MQTLQSNRDIAAFFAQEAVRANVSAVVLTDNAGMRRVFGADAIGLTRYRAARGQSELFFNLDRPDGVAVANISHEIAHATANRQGCDNHGSVWGDAHIRIAERFEARLPGVSWSGMRPTDYAAAEAALYPDEVC